MKIELKKKENNIATIKVETEAGKAKEPYLKTAREFAKHVDVPGFRKGKAPIKMIEERVGVDQIKGEMMNTLLPELLYEAFAKENLEVLSIPSVDNVKFDDVEEPVVIEATIELVPEVTLPDYKGLEVSVDVPEFEEEDYVKQTLEKISSQFATYEEVNDAIKMKDEITFDFDGRIKETGEGLPGMKAESFQIIVEPGRFVGDFLEQMVGMNAGDEKEVEVTFPEAYHEPKLQGKDAIFKVKVHKIARASTSEADDELAKKVGSTDLADLKKRIVDEMHTLQDQNKQTGSTEALVNKIIEGSKADIPDAMVDREVDAILKNYEDQCHRTGANWEEVQKGIDTDFEKDNARNRIMRSLVISAIIKKEKLDMTEEELDKKVEEIVALSPQSASLAKDFNFRSNLKLQTLTDKAIAIVKDAAKIDYVFIKEGEEGKADKKPAKKAAAKKTTAKKTEKKPAAKKAASKKK